MSTREFLLEDPVTIRGHQKASAGIDVRTDYHYPYDAAIHTLNTNQIFNQEPDSLSMEATETNLPVSSAFTHSITPRLAYYVSTEYNKLLQ
ncbi:uncharacterized protein EAE97_004605 [Botrytis byssoidea]|uniref:Uncharacterized protein n=1 Tax=Botrytis byssoidea TaxID=139641 RepID=A0A9P5LWB1_9HELO|nr:uncharacterized protein EAE97_004605 [Botrytis byssoidea]KAF7947356.1 hypothetical protein EAE97_004605 [Botrytis byssoidea]